MQCTKITALRCLVAGGWWLTSPLFAFAHFGGNLEIHLLTFAPIYTPQSNLAFRCWLNFLSELVANYKHMHTHTNTRLSKDILRQGDKLPILWRVF